MDIFEIIYRTSQTDGSPGTTTPAPSDVSWGDVKSKPFNSIGARLTVTSNALSADIQTWAQITGKPFTTLGDSLESVEGIANTVGVTDSFELATGETLVVERGLIVDVIPPES